MAVLVGQRHEDHAARARLQVLHREPGERDVHQKRIHHGLDRLDQVVQAGRARQVGGVVPGVVRGVPAGIDTPYTCSGPIAAHAIVGDHRRVDAAGEAEDDRAEAVLTHVVPQTQHERLPDLGLER